MSYQSYQLRTPLQMGKHSSTRSSENQMATSGTFGGSGSTYIKVVEQYSNQQSSQNRSTNDSLLFSFQKKKPNYRVTPFDPNESKHSEHNKRNESHEFERSIQNDYRKSGSFIELSAQSKRQESLEVKSIKELINMKVIQRYQPQNTKEQITLLSKQKPLKPSKERLSQQKMKITSRDQNLRSSFFHQQQRQSQYQPLQILKREISNTRPIGQRNLISNNYLNNNYSNNNNINNNITNLNNNLNLSNNLINNNHYKNYNNYNNKNNNIYGSSNNHNNNLISNGYQNNISQNKRFQIQDQLNQVQNQQNAYHHVYFQNQQKQRQV